MCVHTIYVHECGHNATGPILTDPCPWQCSLHRDNASTLRCLLGFPYPDPPYMDMIYNDIASICIDCMETTDPYEDFYVLDGDRLFWTIPHVPCNEALFRPINFGTADENPNNAGNMVSQNQGRESNLRQHQDQANLVSLPDSQVPEAQHFAADPSPHTNVVQQHIPYRQINYSYDRVRNQPISPGSSTYSSTYPAMQYYEHPNFHTPGFEQPHCLSRYPPPAYMMGSQHYWNLQPYAHFPYYTNQLVNWIPAPLNFHQHQMQQMQQMQVPEPVYWTMNGYQYLQALQHYDMGEHVDHQGNQNWMAGQESSGDGSQEYYCAHHEIIDRYGDDAMDFDTPEEMSHIPSV